MILIPDKVRDMTDGNPQPINGMVSFEEIHILAKTAQNRRSDRGEATGYTVGFEDGFSDGLSMNMSLDRTKYIPPLGKWEANRLKQLKITSKVNLGSIILMSVMLDFDADWKVYTAICFAIFAFAVTVLMDCKTIGKLEAQDK